MTWKSNSKNSKLTYFPRLIYNRTIRAIEAFRSPPEIDLVTLVNNFEKIEERFRRRKDYLDQACQRLGLNQTEDAVQITSTLHSNVLAGK